MSNTHYVVLKKIVGSEDTPLALLSRDNLDDAYDFATSNDFESKEYRILTSREAAKAMLSSRRIVEIQISEYRRPGHMPDHKVFLLKYQGEVCDNCMKPCMTCMCEVTPTPESERELIANSVGLDDWEYKYAPFGREGKIINIHQLRQLQPPFETNKTLRPQLFSRDDENLYFWSSEDLSLGSRGYSHIASWHPEYVLGMCYQVYGYGHSYENSIDTLAHSVAMMQRGESMVVARAYGDSKDGMDDGRTAPTRYYIISKGRLSR